MGQETDVKTIDSLEYLLKMLKNKKFKFFISFYSFSLFIQGCAIIAYIISFNEQPSAFDMLKNIFGDAIGLIGLIALLVLNFIIIIVILKIECKVCLKIKNEKIESNQAKYDEQMSLLLEKEAKYAKQMSSLTEREEKITKKEVNAEKEGCLFTRLVEHEDTQREALFTVLNNSVSSSYKVYGIGLGKLSFDETRIKNLINRGVNITLCMANPNIFRSIVCKENISNGYCEVLNNHFNNVKLPQTKDDVQSWLESNCSFLKDYMKKYNVLLEQNHIGKYLNLTDYHKDVSFSYEKIESIIDSIGKESNKGTIKLGETNSFIPLSMTIADSEKDANGQYNENAQMIIEYILPYTGKRLMIHILRKNEHEKFDSFVELFEKICENSSLVKSNDKTLRTM